MKYLWLFIICSISISADLPNPYKNGYSTIKFSNAPNFLSKDPKTNHFVKHYIPKFSQESFSIYIPEKFKNKKPIGVIIYIDPSDKPRLNWKSVIKKNNLIYISAHNTGNAQKVGRRIAVSHLGLLKLKEDLKIDPKRIYISGLSGGARSAGQLCFMWPNTYKGCFMVVGASYYRNIPNEEKKYSNDMKYDATPFKFSKENIELAKENCRFVLQTGPKDFRYDEMLDIYNSGYVKDKFTAKFIKIPNGAHRQAKDTEFKKALQFLENK